VPSSALDAYDHRIPEASRARAWVLASARARDPLFGLHMAEQAPIGAYDVLDYALYFSSTLGEALERILRFHRVLCDAWAFARDVGPEVTRLRRVERTPAPEAEAFFALLVMRARELTGMGLAPKEVRFAHAAPERTAPHETFFGCTVRFGCRASELLFKATDLALPIRTANAGVESILERYMGELLERLPKEDSFVERARAAVARTLRRGRPSLHATARELHTSARTVQRWLREHGTTHMAIVDSVRRELAQRFLAEGRSSITETAFLLGFADVGSFRRLYKRWNGATPSRGRSAA
jgi:AraC-like DNA-binding protein